MGNNQKKESKRKRGGQPGNTNALTHGFYSKRFQESEKADLDQEWVDSLESEIHMMRVISRRVLTLAEDVQDLDRAIGLMGAMGMAAIRLARLMRTQKILEEDGDDEFAQAVSEALGIVVKEKGIKL